MPLAITIAIHAPDMIEGTWTATGDPPLWYRQRSVNGGAWSDPVTFSGALRFLWIAGEKYTDENVRWRIAAADAGGTPYSDFVVSNLIEFAS